MANKFLNVLGIMSGTSMDGIDMSIIKTNGLEVKEKGKNFYFRYSKLFRLKLHDFINNFNIKQVNERNFKDINKIFSEINAKAIKKIISKSKVDLIGFHGQTIHHNPKMKKSLQLGDINFFFKKFSIPIIYNFRENDLKHDGQGAPLAPIYHRNLMEKYNFELPSIFLNIGGITNLTYWDGKELIGFDTGPGNCLMDDYIKKRTNTFFDKDGLIASKGISCEKIIKKFMEDSYFKTPPPKSLDRSYFNNFLLTMLKNNLSVENSMNTLAEITISSISNSLSFLPKQTKSVFIAGGGFHNNYLNLRLRQLFNNKIINNDFTDIDVDFIESELIAFLAARSLYKLPITYPNTTGVKTALLGGKIVS